MLLLTKKKKNHSRNILSVTYIRKNSVENLMKMKTTVSFVITSIAHVNTDGLHRVSVI